MFDFLSSWLFLLVATVVVLLVSFLLVFLVLKGRQGANNPGTLNEPKVTFIGDVSEEDVDLFVQGFSQMMGSELENAKVVIHDAFLATEFQNRKTPDGNPWAVMDVSYGGFGQGFFPNETRVVAGNRISGFNVDMEPEFIVVDENGQPVADQDAAMERLFQISTSDEITDTERRVRVLQAVPVPKETVGLGLAYGDQLIAQWNPDVSIRE